MKKLWVFITLIMTFSLAACGANEEVIAELEATADGITLFDSNLTVDIILPETLDGATLSWESANPNFLSNSGAVTRPAYGESDETFSVVLTLSKEDEVVERTFEATVLAEIEIPTEVLLEQLEAASETVTLFDNPLDNDVVLPSTIDDITITWSSSNKAAFTDEGVINRPFFNRDNTILTLTGTFVKEDVPYEANYEVTILAMTEAEALAIMNDVMASIEFEDVLTTQPLLPALVSGVSLTYDSLNDDVMTDNGGLFRQLSTGSNQSAQLEISASYKGVSTSETRDLTIGTFEPLALLSSESVPFEAIDGEYSVSSGAIELHHMNNGLAYVDIDTFMKAISGAVIYSALDYEAGDDFYEISLTITYEDEIYDDDYLYMRFDFENDTVTVNFYSMFSVLSADTETDFGRGLEFIDYKDNSDSLQPVVFDLNTYRLELMMHEGEYLIPFNLANLFLSGSMYNMYYNGDTIYGQDSYDFSSNASSFHDSSLNDEEMPYVLKEISYYYTVMIFEYFYGLQDTLGIESFDDLLKEFTDDWFSQTSVNRHYDALQGLLYELDDMHSSHIMHGPYASRTNASSFGYDEGERNETFSEDIQNIGRNSQNMCYQTDVMYLSDTVAMIPLGRVGSDGYFKGFDDDMTQEFKANIEAIEAKGGIEKIVINVSCNLGGVVGTAWQMLGYLTDEPMQYYSLNAGDGLRAESTFTSDNTTEGTYEWYVLTSPISFSAANMFAGMAKDMGLATIIGAQSEGGAASTKLTILPNGAVIVISSPNLFTDSNYVPLEFGIPVDVEIPFETLVNDRENLDAILEAVSD